MERNNGKAHWGLVELFSSESYEKIFQISSYKYEQEKKKIDFELTFLKMDAEECGLPVFKFIKISNLSSTVQGLPVTLSTTILDEGLPFISAQSFKNKKCS